MDLSSRLLAGGAFSSSIWTCFWKWSSMSRRQRGQRRLTLSHPLAQWLWRICPHGNRLMISSDLREMNWSGSLVCRLSILVDCVPFSWILFVCRDGVAGRWLLSKFGCCRAPGIGAGWGIIYEDLFDKGLLGVFEGVRLGCLPVWVKIVLFGDLHGCLSKDLF